MSEDVNLDIYVKASDMSKYLRVSIKRMPNYYRYDIGDEIKKLLRDIKFKALLLQYTDCKEELYFMLDITIGKKYTKITKNIQSDTAG